MKVITPININTKNKNRKSKNWPNDVFFFKLPNKCIISLMNFIFSYTTHSLLTNI